MKHIISTYPTRIKTAYVTTEVFAQLIRKLFPSEPMPAKMPDWEWITHFWAWAATVFTSSSQMAPFVDLYLMPCEGKNLYPIKMGNKQIIANHPHDWKYAGKRVVV